MIITPRYLGRGSWLARRDPRVPILIGVMAALGVIQVWDARIMVVLLILALTYYRTARIPWRAVRRQWAFALAFVSLLVILNTILTMNAIVGAEDTIDAMDLRAFGATRRTWLRHLVFDRADRLLLLFTFAIFVTITILGFSGNAKLFVFPFLLPA